MYKICQVFSRISLFFLLTTQKGVCYSENSVKKRPEYLHCNSFTATAFCGRGRVLPGRQPCFAFVSKNLWYGRLQSQHAQMSSLSLFQFHTFIPILWGCCLSPNACFVFCHAHWEYFIRSRICKSNFPPAYNHLLALFHNLLPKFVFFRHIMGISVN